MFFVALIGLTMVIYQNNFMPNTRDNQILLLVQIAWSHGSENSIWSKADWMRSHRPEYISPSKY